MSVERGGFLTGLEETGAVGGTTRAFDGTTGTFGGTTCAIFVWAMGGGFSSLENLYTTNVINAIAATAPIAPKLILSISDPFLRAEADDRAGSVGETLMSDLLFSGDG